MLWRWLVRRYRVEKALWDCYWWAGSHYDSYSQWYCARHSRAIRLLVLLVLVVANLVLAFTIHGVAALLDLRRYF